MTLRRYAPLKESRGTVWPPEIAAEIRYRDQGCVGPRVGMTGVCFGSLELDHVRAAGGVSLKSRSTVDNGVQLCSIHHRIKTEDGREWRPRLLSWIAANPPVTYRYR